MTRKWMLLKLLEQTGKHGVNTGDILNAGIGSRYGARLLELREDGYTIRAEKERQGSFRYTLLDSPGEVESGAGSQTDDTQRSQARADSPNHGGCEQTRTARTRDNGRATSAVTARGASPLSEPASPALSLFDLPTATEHWSAECRG